MGRKRIPRGDVLARFISPDDEAIGAEGEDAYMEYLKTGNEEHLELIEGIKPAYYWVKPLTSRAWVKIQHVFVEEEEETDEQLSDKAEAFRSIYLEIAENSIVGCREHQEVVELLPDGTWKVESWNWRVGKPRPEGLLESMQDDLVLLSNVLNFLISVSTLSDREKKASS